MEVNHVVGVVAKQLPDLALLQERISGLVAYQRRQRPEGASQFVTADPRVLGEGKLRLPRMKDVIGIHAVDHIDIVSGVAQLMRQAVDVDRVASESIRWVE